MKTALIACCKSKMKTDVALPAAELYTGQLFRAQLDYTRCVLQLPDEHIYVASARHGLLPITATLWPYEKTLTMMGKAKRLAWGEMVVRRLVHVWPHVDQVYLMAGDLYRNAVYPGLLHSGIEIVVPHPAGLGYARQVAWYREQTNGHKEAA